MFRCWQYAEMVESPYTLERNSLRRKMAHGSLDGHPQIAGGGIGVVHGEVEEGVVDGVREPAVNAALCGVPLGVIGLRRSGDVDV
jgi:hypothetical protein